MLFSNFIIFHTVNERNIKKEIVFFDSYNGWSLVTYFVLQCRLLRLFKFQRQYWVTKPNLENNLSSLLTRFPKMTSKNRKIYRQKGHTTLKAKQKNKKLSNKNVWNLRGVGVANTSFFSPKCFLLTSIFLFFEKKI